MFLRGLPLAALVSAVLAAAAASTQPGTNTRVAEPLAHTDPGGRWSKEVRRKNYRLEGHGQGHRNGRYCKGRVIDDEEKNEWKDMRKERSDENWTRKRREERGGRNNPMEMAWGRIVKKNEEEAKRRITNEEEERRGMFGREGETRRNAEGRLGGMKEGTEIMKERETGDKRWIRRLEYEPKEMGERIREHREEGRFTHQDRDKEREEMETNENDLWREGIKEERMSKWPVNKMPVGRNTFIHERDNGKRINVAAKERKEDTLWRDEMGDRGIRREDQTNRLNKTPINDTGDKFIHRGNGESANVDERERAQGEIVTNAGMRGEKVKRTEHGSDERKARVNGVELKMRRNEREGEGTSQTKEWETSETKVGNGQILRREEKRNNELRMGPRREKEDSRVRRGTGDEKERPSDRREERKGRDELPGRKLESRRREKEETETVSLKSKTKEERERKRKEEKTEKEKVRDEKEEKEDGIDKEEKRKGVIRKEGKSLGREEKEERFKAQEKMTHDLDKKEEGEDIEEKNTTKKEKEDEKNGSRTVDVEDIKTIVMDKKENKNKKNLRISEEEENGSDTKGVEENKKTEKVTERTERETNETNKEERRGKGEMEEEKKRNKTKDEEEKMKTERIARKTGYGDGTNKEEGKIIKLREKEEDKNGNKTKDEDEKTKTEGATTGETPNKNETSKEKLDKENRRGDEKEEGGGRGVEAAVFFLRALKEKGKEKNADEKLLTMQGVKGKQSNAINISNNEEAKEKTPDKLWNMTRKRTGEISNFFSPSETKEEGNRGRKEENKTRWNETMDRSTNERHERPNNEKERDENVREVMILKKMKRELEKQIKRKEKQAENKTEREREENEIVKFGMGGKDDNKMLGRREENETKNKNKNKNKKEERKLSQSQSMALRKDLAHLLREQRLQATEKTKRRNEEYKEKENSKIKPRKYNSERNLKNWIGDENVDGTENREGKEEKRKKRKKMQENIGKATFEFLKEAEKVEGKEKTGERLRRDMLKGLNVSVANRTWEDVKREIKKKEKERKMNEKTQKEAEQRQRGSERILSGVGKKENEDKKENKEEKSKMAGGVTDERKEGNKTEDEKTTRPGDKSVNKAANETQLGDREATRESEGRNVTKGRDARGHTHTQARNKTKEEKEEAIRHMLPPTLVLTHNSSSPKYLLPTWECALSLLGVKANSHVMVRFQGQAKEEASITLHLQREWTPEEVKKAGARDTIGPGDAGEAMLEVSGPGGVNVDVVAREVVRLRNDAWTTFFSVFRKDRVFAVFRAGQQLPLLVYVAPATVTPFIPDLRLVQVWSKSDAEWDLLGDKYRGENGGREPKDPAIRKELTELRDGLTSRLGVAAVLQEHGWRPDDDDPRLMKHKTLRESLATLCPLKILLQYYGRAGSANDSWHDAERVRRFVASRDIGSVLH